MKFPSREIVERIRREYPAGTRVELVRMDDVQAPPAGTKGTVKGVDDTGSLLMRWDNGSGLNVVYGEDIVRKVGDRRANNILKDFFYGNINPNEKQFDRNSEYGKAAAGLADEEEKLRSMLNQEAATVLDKMICLQAAIAGMTAEEYFIDGLRTGFRLALAILDEEENGLLKPISDGGKQP